jgi:hypothetical protein
VGDHDKGSAFDERSDGPLYLRLVFRVKGGGGLVVYVVSTGILSAGNEPDGSMPEETRVSMREIEAGVSVDGEVEIKIPPRAKLDPQNHVRYSR